MKSDALRRHEVLRTFSFGNWEHITETIITKFATNLKRKCPQIQEIYNSYKMASNPVTRKLLALMLLPHLIEPVKYSKFGKPSRSDVQKGFITYFKVFID